MVYLLHFEQNYKRARHYIGFTFDAEHLSRRMEHHKDGSGAKLMRAVKLAGIPWTLARTWPDADRHFERSLKNIKNAARFCPICSPQTYQKHKEPTP